MKINNIQLLRCPVHLNSELVLFPILAKHGEIFLENPNSYDLKETDEIIEGVLVCTSEKHIYPIIRSIPLLLTDHEVQKEFQIECLNYLKEKVSLEIRKIVDSTIEHISNIKKNDEIDAWTNSEINYFDRDVETIEKRIKFKMEIDSQQLWHRYLPRWRYLLKPISDKMNGENVLEIGCGNARTIYKVFHPKHFKYNYIGIDLSFKRLLLAREVLPDGDFIQASTLNMPFADEQFRTIISFGVLHHLPDPQKGLECCISKITRLGFIALHEPILNKKRKEIAAIIKKMIKIKRANEHDRDIDLETIMMSLKAKQFKLLSVKPELSVPLQIIYSLPGKSIFMRSKLIVKLLLSFDSLLLKKFGRMHKLFGPAGILLLAQKETKQE